MLDQLCRRNRPTNACCIAITVFSVKFSFRGAVGDCGEIPKYRHFGFQPLLFKVESWKWHLTISYLSPQSASRSLKLLIAALHILVFDPETHSINGAWLYLLFCPFRQVNTLLWAACTGKKNTPVNACTNPLTHPPHTQQTPQTPFISTQCTYWVLIKPDQRALITCISEWRLHWVGTKHTNKTVCKVTGFNVCVCVCMGVRGEGENLWVLCVGVCLSSECELQCTLDAAAPGALEQC